MTPRRTRLLAVTTMLLFLGLGTAACAGDSASEDSGTVPTAAQADRDAGGNTSLSDGAAAAQAPADAPEMDGLSSTGGASGSATADDAAYTEVSDRSLIKTGTVSLRAEDVDAVRFDVATLADAAGGEVSDSESETGKDGKGERARLTLRVPSAAFNEVMDKLEQVEGATLAGLSSNTEDVSTEVIDTDVRIAVQKRSIERISLLLDRADSIRAIVDVERELSRREADLASLEQRQDYLADQTSMSTITVAIQRPPAESKKEDAAPEKKDDEAGFLSGLEGGWDAFTSVATGLLTALGAVLPFLGAGLVVGVPLWVFLRRRAPAAHPATDPAP